MKSTYENIYHNLIHEWNEENHDLLKRRVQQYINPDDVRKFSHKCEHGDGIVTYWVLMDEGGKEIVKQFIKQDFGEDAHPWEFLWTDEDDLAQNDLLEESDLYSFYPQRIAFKNGKLYAFSANNTSDIIWWDQNNNVFHGFPNSTITDKDYDYYFDLVMYYPDERDWTWLIWRNDLCKRTDIPVEILEQLANSHPLRRMLAASCKNLPEYLVEKLKNDPNKEVRACLANR